jgi:aminoglycoside phosphotransferase
VLAALVGSGLVDPVAACEGQVAVREASRSNHVFVVFVDGRPQHAVKQDGPGADGSLDAERAVYGWLASEPSLVGLAPQPLELTGGEGRRLLVLEGIPDARPAHEHAAALDGEFAALVVELARLLARLHRVSAASTRARDALPAERPWVLELGSAGPPAFVAENPGADAAVSAALRESAVVALLEDARRAWRPAAAIHGDVKWDNVLVRRDGDGLRLWLIDWELAAWGDPLWDLAAVVEGLVTTSFLAEGAQGVAEVGPLARSAVAAYGAAQASRERLLQLVAARLVQVTVQLAGMTGSYEGSAAPGLLRLAGSLADDPGVWAEELYGADEGR